MTRRTRAEMMEETRLKLLNTARQHFANAGFFETVMDDLTAQAGLTRGALYHHFGDKKGLFFAVLQQVDAEMDERLATIASEIQSPWDAFLARCHAYLAMATEPEIQRIVLRDAYSVLDAEQLHSIRLNCISAISDRLRTLMDLAIIKESDPELLARFINGGLMESALWISRHDQPDTALHQAIESTNLLLEGLLA